MYKSVKSDDNDDDVNGNDTGNDDDNDQPNCTTMFKHALAKLLQRV